MSDDDVELHRLRERVYGGAGGSATAAEIARLTELEDAERERRAPRPSAAPETHESTIAAEPEPPDATPPRRRALAAVAAVVAAGVLLAAGFAAGASSPAFLAAPTSTPTPTAPAFPELAFPQTDDDLISAPLIDDSGIDPSSTRYIAVIFGFRVFLAARERGEGVCVVTFTVDDGEPWAAGCTTGGPFDDGAVFGVNEHLSIALGDASRMSIKGTPVRLSDSVTAFVTG